MQCQSVTNGRYKYGNEYQHHPIYARLDILLLQREALDSVDSGPPCERQRSMLIEDDNKPSKRPTAKLFGSSDSLLSNLLLCINHRYPLSLVVHAALSPQLLQRCASHGEIVHIFPWLQVAPC